MLVVNDLPNQLAFTTIRCPPARGTGGAAPGSTLEPLVEFNGDPTFVERARPVHKYARLMSSTPSSTDRLTFRPWRSEDVDAILEIYSDPVAMRFVGDGRPLTRDACLTWLEVTARNHEQRGYGMLAMVDRAGDRPDDRILGCGGIVHPNQQSEPEVKYAIRRSHWGRGIATEAVAAILDHGRDALGLRRIIATSDPANAASHRVLEKNGLLRIEDRIEDDGSLTAVHAIDFGRIRPER